VRSAHHATRQLGIPGESSIGVISGIEFLREVARANLAKTSGQPVKVELPELKGKRVGVVGGGDVAIDAARTALRMGAEEVHVMYRRSGDDMPAAHLPEEIEAALHEGVHIHTSRTLSRCSVKAGSRAFVCSGSGWRISIRRRAVARSRSMKSTR